MLVEPAPMSTAYVDRPFAALAAVALLSVSLGGCATSGGGSSPMDARAEAPASATPSAYLPVEVLPPARERAAMTPDERSKLQKELIAARDRQAVPRKSQGAPPAEPGKPQ
jgi:hypothetical protein